MFDKHNYYYYYHHHYFLVGDAVPGHFMTDTNNNNSHHQIIEHVHVEDWCWHEGHAYYRLSLKTSNSHNTRVIYRRYSDFIKINDLVKLIFSDYQADAIPRFPVKKSSLTFLFMQPSDEFHDKRCRELDWFLQQVMACFGGKHEGFWNNEVVKEFFSVVNGPMVMPATTLKINWSEWDKSLTKARELKMLLEKQHESSTNNPRSIIASHYKRMGDEYTGLVDRLHKQLQLNTTDPVATKERWSRLEELVDYKEKHFDSPHTKSPDQPIDQQQQAHVKNSNSNKLKEDIIDDRLKMQEKQLDLITESMGRLKEMGMEMEKEVKEQNEIAQDISATLQTQQCRTAAATGRVKQL